jgi:hypothetical protein
MRHTGLLSFGRRCRRFSGCVAVRIAGDQIVNKFGRAAAKFGSALLDSARFASII